MRVIKWSEEVGYRVEREKSEGEVELENGK